MAEYIEREALEKKLNERWVSLVQEYTAYDAYTQGVEECCNLVENFPAADVVEVVRCKDCEYFRKAEDNGNGFLVCSVTGMEIFEEDFCSYGERRAE